MSGHYTIPQAADLIGKSTYTVRLWIRLGKLAADKVIDGNGRAVWLIEATSLEQYKPLEVSK